MKYSQVRSVPFKYQLGDWTLFSIPLRFQVQAFRLVDEVTCAEGPTPPPEPPLEDSDGYLMRGVPVFAGLPVISQWENYLRYVPLQYDHCYIDLRTTFETYKKKFSSKTRSTITRKVGKYAAHCAGTIHWQTYKLPEEMREFVRLARAVSKRTYQERLLDAGLPASEEFISRTEALAADGLVRAYILFDGDRPVSYLYLPAQDGVLEYSYVGYDPEYAELSVGTVLLWLAIEQLCNEGHFHYLDFTEGSSPHKQLFATHQRRCANVFFVKRTVRNVIVVYGQIVVDRLSKSVGKSLERMGIKAKIKRLLRFGIGDEGAKLDNGAR